MNLQNNLEVYLLVCSGPYHRFFFSVCVMWLKAPEQASNWTLTGEVLKVLRKKKLKVWQLHKRQLLHFKKFSQKTNCCRDPTQRGLRDPTHHNHIESLCSTLGWQCICDEADSCQENCSTLINDNWLLISLGEQQIHTALNWHYRNRHGMRCPRTRDRTL